MATRLLATDMDGTFIGDDRAIQELWDLLERQGVTLAFSTGRHLQSIESFYAEKALSRRADVCVCMVGTDVHFRGNGSYTLDPAWHEYIHVGWDKDAVEEILRSIPEARMQDEQWQSPFKSSYYLEENAEARLAEINQRLRERGLDAKVVYSADKFLDLLPIKSGKGEAVRYVAEKLGLSPANVVTAGDTGNDLDMMRPELGFRSIAVGNAAPELKAFRAAQVYHAQAAYAAGILEGLREFGWL
ncbi:MAG: HAD-IIB family hydrolase [Phycisphaerae bacterium]|jgi:sucrose phosphatase-like protein